MNIKLFLLILTALLVQKNTIAQNVGIGTNSPSFKLDVNGDGRYNSAAMSYTGGHVNGGALVIGNTNGNGQTIKIDGSNIQSTYSDPQVFPAQNFTRPMVLNPFGGSVGIGTNFTPVFKLHIWANTDELMKIDGKNSLVQFHDNISNAQYGFFRAWTNAPNNPAGYYGLEIGTPPSVGGDPAKRLLFSTNYNLRMTIMETGNIGINTTAPNARLEVNGSLSLPIKTFTDGSNAVTDDDYTIMADFGGNSGKNIAILLPSAVGRKGRIYNIIAINLPADSQGSTGKVNVFYNSSILLTQLLNEYLAPFSPYSYQETVRTKCTVQSDGNNWQVIAENYYHFEDTH